MPRDETWFERLFAETSADVTRYALRRAPPGEAEDAVAETFLVAWRRRENVPDPPEDRLWLYGVARRVLANASRSRRRLDRLRARLASEPQAEAGEPVPEAEAVRAALARLPAGHAEALRLAAWEGLSQREIAAVLGISENAVALRTSRGRRRLRELLDRSGVTADMGDRAARETT